VNPQNCSFTSVTAEFGPDGSIRYNVLGTCNGSPLSGQMAYGTNQQMQEKFYFKGAQISTKAICPADPWISGATCEDQKVAAKGADPGPLLYSRVPLSTDVVSAQVFQNAHANAARPKPPGPPVNAKAIMRLTLSNKIERANVSWLGPDQQGSYGPYLNFVVEARPQHAEGAAWVKLGGVTRHAAPGYQLMVQFPPAPQGTAGWELRTCSTTVFTSTCTGPIIPTAASLTDRIDRLATGSHTDILPPGKDAIDSQRLPSKAFSAPIQSSPSAAGKAALNPQPLPPKAFSESIQSSPSAAEKAALNPQPLPPKALIVPPLGRRSFSGSIMRRGIPEGEAPPADAAPDNASPTEVPLADEKPAP